MEEPNAKHGRGRQMAVQKPSVIIESENWCKVIEPAKAAAARVALE